MRSGVETLRRHLRTRGQRQLYNDGDRFVALICFQTHQRDAETKVAVAPRSTPKITSQDTITQVTSMKMNASSCNSSVMVAMGTFALLLMSVAAAPMVEDEQSENALGSRSEADVDLGPWDAVDAATLRKLILQLDADERLGMNSRVGRSWPQAEPRGWGLRTMDGRLARQWRADKRQVRFRQCYFNPISCFRK